MNKIHKFYYLSEDQNNNNENYSLAFFRWREQDRRNYISIFSVSLKIKNNILETVHLALNRLQGHYYKYIAQISRENAEENIESFFKQIDNLAAEEEYDMRNLLQDSATISEYKNGEKYNIRDPETATNTPLPPRVLEAWEQFIDIISTPPGYYVLK